MQYRWKQNCWQWRASEFFWNGSFHAVWVLSSQLFKENCKIWHEKLCVQMLFISSGYHSFFFCAVIFGMFIFYLHSNTEEEKLDSHYYEFINCGWGYRYLHQNKYLVRNYILHFIMNSRHNLSISFFFLGWIHNAITMTPFLSFHINNMVCLKRISLHLFMVRQA